MSGFSAATRERYAALEVPGPTGSPDSAPFWDAAAERRLVLPCCDDCGAHQPYATPVCRVCWSDRLTWAEVSGRGRVATSTVVHRPGHPGWEPVTPYVLAVVDLEEGVSLMTQISIDPHHADSLHVGDAVHVDWVDVGPRTLPFFTLDRMDPDA